MYLLKIQGQELPMPSEYATVSQEINDEGTERNVMGTMIKNRVAVKKQLTVSWAVGSPAAPLRLVSDTTRNS